MKRIFLVICIMTLVLSSFAISYADNSGPYIVGESAILIDAVTGEILYEKNIHEQHFPASTTKMITAILALENLNLQDPVIIDSETPFTEGSRIYLLEGEQVTVEEVLYGLFLESANDAADALAKSISGSIEEFAKLMNKKAKELGALNTNFINPHGLHDEAHVSTAYDLAMIAKYAMKNQTFRDYVSTYQYTMEATNLQETRYFYNTNRLLYDTVHTVSVNGKYRTCKYEGVTGIKTGYTSQAGGCLVAGAKRGDTELIAVTLKSTDMDRFGDCIALLDYGFANYKTVKTLSEGSDLGTVPVKRGSVSRVSVINPENAYATLPIEASEKLLRTEVELYDKLQAPVSAGQKAGVIKVYAGEELVGEYDAVTAAEVEEGGLLSVLGITDATADKIINLISAVIAVLFLLLILYILIKRRQVKRRRLKRQREKEHLRILKERERARWDEEYWKSRPF